MAFAPPLLLEGELYDFQISSRDNFPPPFRVISSLAGSKPSISRPLSDMTSPFCNHSPLFLLLSKTAKCQTPFKFKVSPKFQVRIDRDRLRWRRRCRFSHHRLYVGGLLPGRQNRISLSEHESTENNETGSNADQGTCKPVQLSQFWKRTDRERLD